MSIRLLLTDEQSEQLKARCHDGPVFFAAGRASFPDGHTIALHLIPCPNINTANAAVRVATGEATARKKPPQT